MTEHRPEEVEGLESARGPEMPVLPFKSKCCRDCILPITDIIEPSVRVAVSGGLAF